MATGLFPAQGVLPFSDPVLNSPTTVVHLNHFPGRELGIGHNEPDPWGEFPIVRLDLSDSSPIHICSMGIP